jgi:poly(hydroxyalkanoate) depolymerase family esterase
LADQWGFALLLPEQKKDNNRQACFNWFRAGDTQRDQGEVLSIKQMIDKLQTDYVIDPHQIYVTGLSAGGAMAVALLSTYPDVFTSGAIIAGIPYRCASGLFSGLWCMYVGRDFTPTVWGDQVRQATANTKLDRKSWPTVSIWQGENDATVKPMNATELMQQWTNVHGISQVPAVEDSVKGYAHKVYNDTNGNAVVETYTITGMKHGVPIDPGNAEDQCGTAADYIVPAGICSSYYIAKFWGLDKAH